jgi:hypothetical protein
MQTTGIVRQDTLPADDPSWQRSPYLPGQPVPIPPRNEKPIYIPNGAYDMDKTPRTKPREEICEESTDVIATQPLASEVGSL